MTKMEAENISLYETIGIVDPEGKEWRGRVRVKMNDLITIEWNNGTFETVAAGSMEKFYRVDTFNFGMNILRWDHPLQ